MSVDRYLSHPLTTEDGYSAAHNRVDERLHQARACLDVLVDHEVGDEQDNNVLWAARVLLEDAHHVHGVEWQALQAAGLNPCKLSGPPPTDPRGFAEWLSDHLDEDGAGAG